MKRKIWHIGIMALAALVLSVLTEHVNMATWQISTNAYAGSNPLIGTWGSVLLGHGRPGNWCTWKTESEQIIFNSNSAAVSTYAESADICPNANYCKQNDASNLNFTDNPDGTFSLDIYDAVTGRYQGLVNGVTSSDGNMYIADGVTGPELQALMVGVKPDTTKQYSNSDLSGDYYYISYEYNSQGGTNGHNRAWSTILSMDGAGNLLTNGTLNGDGTILTVANTAGLYNVNPNGFVTINNYIGWASVDANVLVLSNTTTFYPQTGNDFVAAFAMKKQDRAYSTADLSGEWAYTALGDNSGSVRSEYGTIICNSSGACQLSANVLHADNSITVKNKSETLSIQTDGSYNGFSLSGAMPQFSGAIGNNGNTMFLALNDDNTDINDRLIGLAIKINNPTYSVSPAVFSFSSSSGTGSIIVTSSSNSYSWTAMSNDSWITITSGDSGTGTGTVTFNVAANTTGSAQIGTITVAGQPITIMQAGATFSDVSENVFTPYIYSLFTNAITVGCGNSEYCPSENVTRDQMAAFIIRALYTDTFTIASQTSYFSDVPTSDTFFNYVQKVKDEGITVGCGNGEYCPSEDVTRDQMAAFLVRATQVAAGQSTTNFTCNGGVAGASVNCASTTPYFSDVPATDSFFPYVQKLKELGITTGCGNGQYCPSEDVTRDQMAAFLARAFLGMQ